MEPLEVPAVQALSPEGTAAQQRLFTQQQHLQQQLQEQHVLRPSSRRRAGRARVRRRCLRTASLMTHLSPRASLWTPLSRAQTHWQGRNRTTSSSITTSSSPSSSLPSPSSPTPAPLVLPSSQSLGPGAASSQAGGTPVSPGGGGGGQGAASRGCAGPPSSMSALWTPLTQLGRPRQ